MRVLEVEMPDDSFERLFLLRRKTRAPKLAEVLGAALQVYEGLIAEIEAGNEAVIVKPDGTKKPILDWIPSVDQAAEEE